MSHPTKASYPTILGGKVFLFIKENTLFSGENSYNCLAREEHIFFP
jgi:hypothetical protein